MSSPLPRCCCPIPVILCLSSQSLSSSSSRASRCCPRCCPRPMFVVLVPSLSSRSSLSLSSSCPCRPVLVVPCLSSRSSSLFSSRGRRGPHRYPHPVFSVVCLIAVSTHSPPCKQLLAMAGPGAGSWSHGLAFFPSHPLFAIVPSQQIYNL